MLPNMIPNEVKVRVTPSGVVTDLGREVLKLAVRMDDIEVPCAFGPKKGVELEHVGEDTRHKVPIFTLNQLPGYLRALDKREKGGNRIIFIECDEQGCMQQMETIHTVYEYQSTPHLGMVVISTYQDIEDHRKEIEKYACRFPIGVIYPQDEGGVDPYRVLHAARLIAQENVCRLHNMSGVFPPQA